MDHPFFFRIEPKDETGFSPIRSERFWTRAAGFSSRLPVNDVSAAARSFASQTRV